MDPNRPSQSLDKASLNCKFCHRGFRRLEHLQRHTRIHTNEKPFSCPCGALFSRKDLLRRHERASHDDLEHPVQPPVSSNSPTSHLQDHRMFNYPSPASRETREHFSSVSSQRPVSQKTSPQRSSIRESSALDNELIETESLNHDSGLSGHCGQAHLGSDMCVKPHTYDDHTATHVMSNMLSASFPIPALSLGGQVISHASLPVVTDSHRVSLLGSLRIMNIMPGFDLPSSDSLTRFLAGYFTGFYPRMPFTHAPSFRIEECDPGLFLAMTAIGAVYRYEMKTAYNLFYVAKSIFLDKHRHRESNDFTRVKTGRNNAQEIRGLLCLLTMASWQKDPELENETFMLQSLLVHSMRVSGLDDTLIQAGDLDWETWAQKESDRRTKLLVFCFLNIQSIAYNLPPGLLSKEIRLRLPCSCPEWTAADAATWEMLHQNTPNEQEYFHIALQNLSLPASGTRVKPSFTSPVANYVLLHGLIQSIICTQQILPFPGPVSSSNSQAFFEAALRKWTESWQITPESNLEPLDPNGPLPFTSSTLLSLAYIRNCLDTGRSKVLSSWDPVKTASFLHDSPPLKHNWHVFLAAIHATRVLGTLVKLGIRYVQHSQASVWSIEDALCGLECAVFLSQWLREVGDMTRANSESENQRVLVKWVREIVQEALVSISSDPHSTVLSTPDELATEVIKLWTLIMQGSSPWSFMGAVADVLIIYGGGFT